MTRPLTVAWTSLMLVSLSAAARVDREPCRIRSRPMTLAKNCYIGEMEHPLEGGGQFFGQIENKKKGVRYCFNALTLFEHQPGDVMVHVRVLHDNKSGQLEALRYSIPQDELKANKHDVPLMELKGLRGECFSPNPEACKDGLLKTLGWQESSLPMILALGKASSGQYTSSHLVMEEDIGGHVQPRQIEGHIESDPKTASDQLVHEVRKKIMSLARQKIKDMHAGVPFRKLAEASEQFRYCTMALESYLRDKKLPEPFSSEEKMSLAVLNQYLNGESGLPPPQPSSLRQPASVKSKGR